MARTDFQDHKYNEFMFYWPQWKMKILSFYEFTSFFNKERCDGEILYLIFYFSSLLKIVLWQLSSYQRCGIKMSGFYTEVWRDVVFYFIRIFMWLVSSQFSWSDAAVLGWGMMSKVSDEQSVWLMVLSFILTLEL